jgi:Tfp pilus assembly pilus retraction ATPase PilT
MTPLADPQFNLHQSEAVRKLVERRMLGMPASDFAELLRSAMREDEWLLLLHGAVLGFGAGLLHLLIFG